MACFEGWIATAGDRAGALPAGVNEPVEFLDFCFDLKFSITDSIFAQNLALNIPPKPSIEHLQRGVALRALP